jgi:hypothetical protein
MHAQRYTVGGRIRVFNALAVQINAVRQRGIPGQKEHALDVAATYVLRLDSIRSP